MFHYGVDYYPEYWGPERLEIDAKLMKEAGTTVVRLAEFAWSKMEPAPDQYDFGWLDQAIEVLNAHEIQVILCTPTAVPAPWVMSLYPDAYRVMSDGLKLEYGNRRNYCPNHAGYRERSRRVTRAMAEHYRNHPGVIGWQLDNEWGDRCACDTCKRAFHSWLQKKYGTLDRLNRAWGTTFWSHIYTEWAQIPVARGRELYREGVTPNPGLGLDYYRFQSDSYVGFEMEQVEILRSVTPEHFITHNFMGLYDRLNYFDVAKPLDVVAFDAYPIAGFGKTLTMEKLAEHALAQSVMRGLKQKNHWMMEQQSGAGGWDSFSSTPAPGVMRLMTYASIARGADAVLHFRWRTCPTGTEQYWHGVLYHHGEPGWRYDEMKQIGTELKQIGELLHGTEPKAQVGMLNSYDSNFAWQLQPNHPGFHYWQAFKEYYQALYQRNLGASLLSPEMDWSAYPLLIAPALYVVDETLAARLRSYVEQGGTLVLGARTAAKDGNNAVPMAKLPAGLTDLCGMEVEDYDSLPQDYSVPVKSEVLFSEELTATRFCEILTPRGAEVLAEYDGDYYQDQPAVTVNRFGQGKVIYIGSLGGQALVDDVLEWVLNEMGIAADIDSPPLLEVVERVSSARHLYFLLNHADRDQMVKLPFEGVDLLSGDGLSGYVTIEARNLRIVERK